MKPKLNIAAAIDQLTHTRRAPVGAAPIRAEDDAIEELARSLMECRHEEPALGNHFKSGQR